jgi:hypothetical protein
MSKKIGNQVDTYHINIGVGDCSVVLDVDPVKKIINNCVLIDGGYGTYKKQFGPWQAIKDFMTVTLPGKLKNLYYTNITADQLKFTSIVISHWDGVSNCVLALLLLPTLTSPIRTITVGFWTLYIMISMNSV